MKENRLKIYGVTGYISPESYVEPLLPCGVKLQNDNGNKEIRTPISNARDKNKIPPMLPIISKF